MTGLVLTAAVPAQSLADIQTRPPDGTMQAPVASIDGTDGWEMRGAC